MLVRWGYLLSSWREIPSEGSIPSPSAKYLKERENKMELTFLGSGSAFTNDGTNYQSNMILEHNGKRLLIDCGGDVRFPLR